MNFSSIINCLNELTQEEIYDLGEKLIRDNTLFFRHLLFKLHSISDHTEPNHGSNHTTPFSESVERKSYFIDLYLHSKQCREIHTCARDGCFLSKCVLVHFFRCTTRDKNINCKVCEMTRDQINQGMIDYYNNLIMHHCVEFDPKRKRKYDREEDDQVEDEEEEVEIKKQKMMKKKQMKTEMISKKNLAKNLIRKMKMKKIYVLYAMKTLKKIIINLRREKQHL